ncbi:class I SAM-dependent methyltransferase [Lacticaseibacillus brantae]|uniref:SAM-dependent methyltransferase n=1 Tax=Lacticaseibacillus brantae DSM 23927 TaxID=1423727 RepID=A0A0R2B0C7_9LACO|nr:methyltransferase domain-containing protein [Lacticaseibacillus brantae]KRM72832.1 SAM-dependent methyltransferase [Lacticaseibacillus brantae DSM 23927]
MANPAVNTILAHMLHDETSDIQAVQTTHRLALIDAWQIQPGEHILEIGSGQGDMLAALAYAVGPTGQVTGVDIASRDYGAPYTIGQAIDALLATDYGPRLRVYFNRDISQGTDFLNETHFDRVVLAHSLWYFDSLAQLAETLRVAKALSSEILLAEWDLEMTAAAQQNHYIAASVQGQLRLFSPHSKANIRTLITKPQVNDLARQLQLTVADQGVVVDPAMQDGQWEVSYVQSAFTPDKVINRGASPEIATFLTDQVALIHGRTVPLNTFWFRLQDH